MELQNLLAIAVAFFAVTVSPGPANIALSAISAGFGRRAGLLFGFGLATGLSFWGLVAATGMGAVLHSSAQLLVGLKLVGGAYLLWLAYRSARAASQTGSQIDEITTRGRWFMRGLVLNLSNPKAVVAWMAALAVGLDPGHATTNVMLATLVCMLLGLANYAGYALIFSTGRAMRVYRLFQRWIEGTVAVLFAGAGLGLIRSAFAR